MSGSRGVQTLPQPLLPGPSVTHDWTIVSAVSTMSSEPEKPIADLAETDKPHSVCVMVSQDECQEDKKTEIKDRKDNAGSVVIRIEPAATAETDSKNTDSLNSNNSCEKHRGGEQSLSSTESDGTTNSLSSEEEDGAGLANPAFVDDEMEEGKKRKKGHQRRPSCSPNKDIEVNGPIPC